MRAPRIMAMDASASCKAKLATAEHHSLQLPATSRKCRKKQLPMLIFYSWMPADDTGNARQCVQCDQGFFLIFFWIEFVPVILYLEFCMDVDRPCLYLPSKYIPYKLSRISKKNCTLYFALTCIIFTRFVVPYTTEDKYWQQWACSSWTDHSDM